MPTRVKHFDWWLNAEVLLTTNDENLIHLCNGAVTLPCIIQRCYITKLVWSQIKSHDRFLCKVCVTSRDVNQSIFKVCDGETFSILFINWGKLCSDVGCSSSKHPRHISELVRGKWSKGDLKHVISDHYCLTWWKSSLMNPRLDHPLHAIESKQWISAIE